MMQFFQEQTLQPFGGLLLCGIDASLRQQARGIHAGLREQVAKTGIFDFERVFVKAFSVACHDRAYIRAVLRT